MPSLSPIHARMGFSSIYPACPTSEFATRYCSENGFWLDEEGNEAHDPSWSDFRGCFAAELTKVIEGFYSNISGESLKLCNVSHSEGS